MTNEPITDAQLAEWERIAALDYCPVREEEIASAVPALIAEVRRLRKERYDLLNVRTKEGMLASEWLSRTATAEAEVRRLRAEIARAVAEEREACCDIVVRQIAAADFHGVRVRTCDITSQIRARGAKESQ